MYATHRYPHPCKYMCSQQHPHSEEYVKTYLSGNTKHAIIAAVCTNIILSFLMSNLCSECCRCSAETYKDILLRKAVPQHAPPGELHNGCTAKSSKPLFLRTWISSFNDFPLKQLLKHFFLAFAVCWF